MAYNSFFGLGAKLGRLRALAVAASALLLMPGCAELPAAAPTAAEIMNNSAYADNGVAVFDLDAQVISALANARREGFAQRFTSKAPPAELPIAIGDTLQFSVIEESPDLLEHTPNSGASRPTGGIGGATLLPISVGQDGMITVPYAGRIRAAGRTIDALRAEIERKLADKLVNPQVQLALVGGASAGANSATVGGEVNRAGVIALRPSGSRLLDVIAEAGGARFPAYESTVHLTRRKSEAADSLQRIVDTPGGNIYVYPGDDIYVSHDPRTYSVLGASTKDGRYAFGSANLNLAEAVAEAGGFVDTVSDPSGVFVFRYEQPAVVESLRPNAAISNDAPVPVIYRLNLRDGDGYFRAGKFAMRDKDIVLVANADETQVQKFLTLVTGITGVGVNLAETKALLKPPSTGGTTILNSTQ